MDRNHLHQLVDKLNNDQLSVEERKELMDFYNGYQWSSVWDESSMGEAIDVKEQIFAKIQQSQDKVATRKVYHLMRYIRIAAACLVVGAFSWLTYLYILNREELIVVHTDKETKEVLLPDGSKVTLNVNSSVSYPAKFEGDLRSVSFSGEGFFEVQSDSLHPFIVSTAQVKIRVLGTSFNVKAYQEDPAVEASLLHGKIEVLKAEDDKVLSTLKPNEKFVLKKDKTHQEKSSTGQPQIAVHAIEYIGDDETTPVDIAWKEGKFAFVSMPLQDIGREMKRRYGIDIKIENSQIANHGYSATFEEETVDEMLRALIMVKSFSYRKEGSTIVIY